MIAKTFPALAITAFNDADEATAAARAEPWDAMVVHRSLDSDGLRIIKKLRQARPGIPIIMISGRDQTEAAAEAGADRFLQFDNWNQIGAVLAEEFKRRNPDGVSPR